MALTSCQRGQLVTTSGADRASKMTVKSSAFADGEAIPAKYAVDGPGISPPIEWSGAPGETKSFALLMDDPDAPVRTFNHWVVYAIPHDVMKLDENLPKESQLKSGIRQGKNDGGKIGYYPPAPPFGTHHYRFKVYALDSEPSLKPGASLEEFREALNKHIIGEGLLTGTYKRK